MSSHCISRTTQIRQMNEAQKNAIASVFYECDLGHKGYLNREDIKMAVVSLFGYKPSKSEVCQIFNKSTQDCNSYKGLKLEEFMEAMSLKVAAQDEDDLIRQTFLVFDSQCRGFLTVEDLKKVISQVAPHLSAHTVESAFREVDRDGNGRVSYKDFEFMMKYNQDDGF